MSRETAPNMHNLANANARTTFSFELKTSLHRLQLRTNSSFDPQKGIITSTKLRELRASLIGRFCGTASGLVVNVNAGLLEGLRELACFIVCDSFRKWQNAGESCAERCDCVGFGYCKQYVSVVGLLPYHNGRCSLHKTSHLSSGATFGYVVLPRNAHPRSLEGKSHRQNHKLYM